MPFGIDLFRTTQRLGREVIVGLSWDMVYVFTALAALIFLVHYILRELWNPTAHTTDDGEPSKDEVEQSLQDQGIEEVSRFTLAQRASHWIMAVAVFALMLSGFIIMNTEVTLRAIPGLSWLTLHIVAAIVLIGYVLFHLGHIAYKGTWSKMWIGGADLRDLWRRFTNLIGLTDEYPRQFEYPSAQKFLHWGVTAATLGVIVTGLVLLRRVSLEPLWSATREFSFLGVTFGLGTADAMGLVSWSFVLHDLAAIGLLALVMGHVYFALRPNEWGITKSMITGNVSVEHYAEKYAPSSWQVGATKASDGGQDADDPED